MCFWCRLVCVHLYFRGSFYVSKMPNILLYQKYFNVIWKPGSKCLKYGVHSYNPTRSNWFCYFLTKFSWSIRIRYSVVWIHSGSFISNKSYKHLSQNVAHFWWTISFDCKMNQTTKRQHFGGNRFIAFSIPQS